VTTKDIIDVIEQKRLNDAREAGIPWKKWGPYLSEGQWGTVREATGPRSRFPSSLFLWAGGSFVENRGCMMARTIRVLQ
jgi:hypothetical protein